MRRSAHWTAIDPLDLRPDEWLTDPAKYKSWSCNLGAVPLASSEAPPAPGGEAAAFRQQVAELESVEGCGRLGAWVNAQGWASAAAPAVAVAG